MRTLWLVGFLGIMLALAACQPVQHSIVCPDGSVVANASQCPAQPAPAPVQNTTTTTPSQPTPTPPPAPAQTNPTQQLFGSNQTATAPAGWSPVQLLLRAHNKTANGYSYLYQLYSGGIQAAGVYGAARVSVKPPQIAIDFPGKTYVAGSSRQMTRLVANMKTNTSTGYCVGCGNLSPIALPYSAAQLASPLSMLSSFTNATIVGTTETYDSRQVYHLKGDIDGQPVELWADTYSGLPLKVQFSDRLYTFTGISLGVSDSVFTPSGQP